jgi:hypothetical protein
LVFIGLFRLQSVREELREGWRQSTARWINKRGVSW